MTNALIDATPVVTPPDMMLQTVLNEAKIPFDPACLEGIDGSVANELTGILEMDATILQIYMDDYYRVRNDALNCDRQFANETILEFVVYEKYAHIWKIYGNQAVIQMTGRQLTDDESKIVEVLSTNHISSARKAIEATIHFRETLSPTELWNYFDRILNGLEKEFMKAGHTSRKVAQEIIDDITVYKAMQEKLVFA